MLAEKTEYLVKMVARLLEVSRSGFYPWLADGAPTDGWGHARDAVERVWLEGDRRFGERMVHAFLPPEFGPVTLYRVRKCMREPGVRGVTPLPMGIRRRYLPPTVFSWLETIFFTIRSPTASQ